MSNCENWYDMTEKALPTLNKVIPIELSDAINDPNPSAIASIAQQQPAPINSIIPNISKITESQMIIESMTGSGLRQVSSGLLESGSMQATQMTLVDDTAPKLNVALSLAAEVLPTCDKDNEKQLNLPVGRGVTLNMLLSDGLVKPGADVLSFDFAGQKFTADLLEDSKVKWGKTETIFTSTSAWIVHCKKVVAPNEKLTCSSSEQVKYKGRSLDIYKSVWLKKHKPFVVPADNIYDIETDLEGMEEEKIEQTKPVEDNEYGLNWMLTCSALTNSQESVPHAKLGKRNFQGIPNLFVECLPFSNVSRVQPFRLNITKNCLLLLHFHCHLVSSEVVGYLAGKWDSSAQQLIVTQAYPCKCFLNSSKDETDKVEYEAMSSMDKSNLVLVGWYHSHVGCQADPTLKDVETQMEYQFQLKGYESSTFQPCVGLIVSPFYTKNSALPVSDTKIFYVHPPPEQRPLDFGMPLEVEHTVSKDDYVTDRIITEMEKLLKFYSNGPDYLPKKFKKTDLPFYLNKLKDCLSPYCPSGYLSESIVKIFESF